MAKTTDTDSAPLQTVEEAIDGPSMDALNRLAGNLAPETVKEAPKPEEPATEPKAEGETNADLSQEPPEEAPADDADADLPEVTKKRVQERINQFKKQAAEAAEKAAAIEAQLAERQAEFEAKLKELEEAQAEPARPNNANLPEVQKLSVEVDKFTSAAAAAKQFLRRLKADPDATIEELRQRNIYHASSAIDAEGWLEDMRDQAVEQRQKLERQRDIVAEREQRKIEAKVAEARKETSTRYPWYEKPTPEHKAIQARLRKEFNGIQNAPLIEARLIAAELAEKGVKKAPIIPPKVPTTGKTPAAPPKPNGKPALEKILQQVFDSGGKEEDVARLIEAKF